MRINYGAFETTNGIAPPMRGGAFEGKHAVFGRADVKSSRALPNVGLRTGSGARFLRQRAAEAWSAAWPGMCEATTAASGDTPAFLHPDKGKASDTSFKVAVLNRSSIITRRGGH